MNTPTDIDELFGAIKGQKSTWCLSDSEEDEMRKTLRGTVLSLLRKRDYDTLGRLFKRIGDEMSSSGFLMSELRNAIQRTINVLCAEDEPVWTAVFRYLMGRKEIQKASVMSGNIHYYQCVAMPAALDIDMEPYEWLLDEEDKTPLPVNTLLAFLCVKTNNFQTLYDYYSRKGCRAAMCYGETGILVRSRHTAQQRQEELKRILRKYRNEPAVCRAVAYMVNYRLFPTKEETDYSAKNYNLRIIHKLIDTYIERFKDSAYVLELRDIQENYAIPEYKTGDFCLEGAEMLPAQEVTVTVRNVPTITVSVYRLALTAHSKDNYDIAKKSDDLGTPIYEERVEVDIKQRRFHSKHKIHIPQLGKGTYVLRLCFGEGETALRNNRVLQVSRLAAMAVDMPDGKCGIMVADKVTGKPVSRAVVLARDWSGDEFEEYVCDEQGLVVLPSEKRDHRIYEGADDTDFITKGWFGNYEAREKALRKNSIVLTNREEYKIGERIQMAAISYARQKDGSLTLLPEQEICLSYMRDSFTDTSGVCADTIAIPSMVKNGEYYFAQRSYDNEIEQFDCNAKVMVSGRRNRYPNPPKKRAKGYHRWLSSDVFPMRGDIIAKGGSGVPGTYVYTTVFCGDKVLENSCTLCESGYYERHFSYKEEYGDGILLFLTWLCKGRFVRREAFLSAPLEHIKVTVPCKELTKTDIGHKLHIDICTKDERSKAIPSRLVACVSRRDKRTASFAGWKEASPVRWWAIPKTEWHDFGVEGKSSIESYEGDMYSKSDIIELLKECAHLERRGFPVFYEGEDVAFYYEREMRRWDGLLYLDDYYISEGNDTLDEKEEDDFLVNTMHPDDTLAYFSKDLWTDENGCVAIDLLLPACFEPTKYDIRLFAFNSELAYGVCETSFTLDECETEVQVTVYDDESMCIDVVPFTSWEAQNMELFEDDVY